MGEHFHRPAPLLSNHRPAHIQSPHHRNRSRLLPTPHHKNRQNRKLEMTTLRHHTPHRWGQIRRARWGEIKLTFPRVVSTHPQGIMARPPQALWHRLYFSPDSQGHCSLRPTFELAIVDRGGSFEPTRPIDWVIPRRLQASANASDVYWVPISVWKMTPRGTDLERPPM